MHREVDEEILFSAVQTILEGKPSYFCKNEYAGCLINKKDGLAKD